MLPPVMKNRFLGMKDTNSNLNDEQQLLFEELKRLVPTKKVEQTMITPCFILSRKTVRAQLRSHRTALENAVGDLDNLKIQMCLSVKTQPHEMVLKEAHEAGYL